MKRGKVYLVGSGPGDPKLITLRGIECIKSADVIIYDYLANERLLTYSKDSAEIIYVGKKGGDHTLPQYSINQLIIQKVKEGKIVARLKGGDPFVFGRGGEEAEELADAGMEFEIVPGVTSAIACPAYAGIPLTHRLFTSTAAFITGHEDPTKDDSNIAWDKIATGIGTLVFLMGMSNLSKIVKNLIRYGRDPRTPVALVRWGTLPEQKTVTGTLEDIVSLSEKNNIRPPVVIIVGDVIKLKEKLNWFEKRPLFGKKIVVTRAREQASAFADLLSLYGAEPIEFPTIQVVPPESWSDLDEAISKIEGFDWIIFTSVNGVRYFIERLRANKRDIRILKGIKICTIGPKTKDEIERYSISPDLVPAEYRAEAIIEQMGRKGIRDKKILIPRAEVAREILPEELTRMGAVVEVKTAYKTVRPDGNIGRVRELFREKKISVITFTSSSTVKNFVEAFSKEDVSRITEGAIIASIGPITAKTAQEYGIKTDIMPQEYIIPALTEAIAEYYRG
ncbi:MAG: uroporphyrinogen-III C-methyltransferase [Nitrospirota bacterium]